ncbi:5-bromo-4-chloroindolyl phosphate hydrolysis protein [Faecalibacterium sp. An77]|uniref:5-bromo-4-chloroindolyl phosphate hydrolysis family protein n=1 Tax=Faecalibacterium sp. An77 TaxID=1965655 RepID=UPI000B379CA8|nr:5-bromo-4-chloroindolyl phosphate hydrolysis family protein [Faecalibacterium sp. An77]OUN40712.1 5-bromo-4-chloroindolyl phosphate hydrolysis protein [Faecalibacterium sp. An77]
MQPQRRHYFAHIPTIALLILLGLAPWLSVILFIVRAIDRDSEKKELRAARERQEYAADFRPQDTRQANSQNEPYNYSAHYTANHDHPTLEQQRSKRHQQKITQLCTIAGAILLVTGVVGMGDWIGSSNWNALFTFLCMIVGGGGALAFSLMLKRVSKLERQLDKVVGDQDNIPLQELFAAAGIPADKGRKILESAIDHGYFGPDAYIDNRTDFLVVRGAAPIPAPPPAPEPDPTDETQYEKLLRQLHQAGSALSDPVMQEKAARLEQISARIFALAEKDASKQEQLRKFISYYLPTSLKLLNTYAQLDSQGVAGENITRTKQSIQRSLDLLVTAFENQLDKLFQSDALDVSADIAALEGMLNLDGLSGDSGFSVQP